mmetsp:Transcript_115347/g.337226  ORF Transcript_115347/g.337226 Transcript_115347/m.337226 type:complete len:430 (-) Transcript_115347:67-1356(-)
MAARRREQNGAAESDPLEHRLLRLESDVVNMNRSLHSDSRLGRALRPTDTDEWASSAGDSSNGISWVPSSMVSWKSGNGDRQLNEELQHEIQGGMCELEHRIDDVQAKLNKAVQRLSAAQAAMQEHCAQIAAQVEAGPSGSLDQIRVQLAAVEARLEGRCAALESRVVALSDTQSLDQRFAEIKAMVGKHCSAIQEHLCSVEPVADVLASPRKERLSADELLADLLPMPSPRKKAWQSLASPSNASLTSQDTLSTVEDERMLSSRTRGTEGMQAGGRDLDATVRLAGCAELLERIAEVRAAGEGRCQGLEAQIVELRERTEPAGRLTDGFEHLRRRVDVLAKGEPVEALSDRVTLRMAALESSCSERCGSLEELLESRCGLLEAKIGPRSVAEVVGTAADKLDARITAIQALTERRCSQVESQVCARQR